MPRPHDDPSSSSRVMTFYARCVPFFCLALATHAQVPRGWAVASNSAGIQPGGLTMFHPLVPGPSVPITGALPAQITGTGVAYPYSAASVLIDDTGNLTVGTRTPGACIVRVFLLTLNGSTVVATSAYHLGIATPVAPTGWVCGSTDQMAWVGRDILVSNREPMMSGPFANASLGWVRPRLGPPGTPGTLVPITTTTAMMGTTNALAVDPAGQFAFLGRYWGGPSGPYTSLIYKIPLTGTGPVTPTLLALVPDVVQNLAVRPDGYVIAAVVGNVNANALHVIDGASGMIQATSPVPCRPTALAIDPATGDVLIGDDTRGHVLRSTPLYSSYYY